MGSTFHGDSCGRSSHHSPDVPEFNVLPRNCQGQFREIVVTQWLVANARSIDKLRSHLVVKLVAGEERSDDRLQVTPSFIWRT